LILHIYRTANISKAQRNWHLRFQTIRMAFAIELAFEWMWMLKFCIRRMQILTTGFVKLLKARQTCISANADGRKIDHNVLPTKYNY